ncbi:TolC family protein [Leptothrix discophora]|uniref:TolC family protein n=1 Tax=Leptothrix discophora TaxID=89 RepID=A0ABT9G443_LEPDI|nr:TolC family protein [Leptothrix discophora]MDP4301253.1 TolC family protein [Leptothrix discophora]
MALLPSLTWLPTPLTARLPAVLLALGTLAPAAWAQGPAGPSGPAESAAASPALTASWGERQARDLLAAVAADDGDDRPEAGPAWQALRRQLADSLLQHPEARAARASGQGARAATREAAAAQRPQLGLEAETGHRDNAANELQGTPRRDWDTGSIGLTLRQPLWDGGTVQAQVDASTAFADGVEARAEARSVDLLLRSLQAALERVRSQRLLEQARSHLAAREEMVVDLERRHRLGGGTLSDVWRARSRAVEARGAVVQAEARLAQAEAACVELLGADAPAGLDLGLPRLTPLPQLARQVRERDASLRAAEDFAAVRAAQAAVRTAEHERDVARRRDGPRVDLDAGISRRDLVGGRRAGTDWQAGVTLRHSFYSGGADDARIAQAQARLDEATEQLRNTRLQLDRSMRQALADAQIGEPLREARREGVRLAVDALRGVREQFANRRGSLLDVMNAQDALQAAGNAWVEAEHARALAHWRLAHFTAALLPWVTAGP